MSKDTEERPADDSSVKDEKPADESLMQGLKNKAFTQAEALQFLQQNKDRLEKSLASIDKRDLFSKFTTLIMAIFSKLAGWIDIIKRSLINWLMKIPAPEIIKQSLHTASVVTNFKGMIDFIRTKFYAFRKSPYNEKLVQHMDELIGHATQQGLDFKQHFPEVVDKLVARKNQMLQHSYFKEFNKSPIERLLATPFSFKRSLSPVLPDRAMWHKLFGILEARYIQDIILVDEDGKQASFKNDSKRQIESSHSVRHLYEASVFKAHGHRVFIIGHHEGYLGPYFVRSALRRLGFDNLAENNNTVVGPRMFSSLFLKSGASNVGNMFLTLPSQRTTKVNEDSLAAALQKSARRTQFLIKMPNSGLKLIEQFSYRDFMQLIQHYQNLETEQVKLNNSLSWLDEVLDTDEQAELIGYLCACDAASVAAELDKRDYDLFKQVMHEPFLIFPEGSRSYVEDNGDITLKYFNPKYLQAYLRPGDVILPLSLVGGADILQGVKLTKGKLGLSLGSPYKVTSEMIENYETEGVEIMRNIARLPNIKNVHLDDTIQAGIKRES
jgi:sulfur relay (sulfurtransferase) DsrC/TusE family protein|tara:strand:- start:1417 stop:3075 length:1659 start_codon:yes stop_codon:yes gene_type:complete